MTKLSLAKGDSLVHEWEVIGADGTATNLDENTIYFTVKKSYLDSDTDSLIRKTSAGSDVVIVNAELGQVRVIINPIDTESLNDEVTYVLVWDIKRSTAAGAVYTFDSGEFVVTRTVRRTTV